MTRLDQREGVDRVIQLSAEGQPALLGTLRGVLFFWLACPHGQNAEKLFGFPCGVPSPFAGWIGWGCRLSMCLRPVG